MARIQSDKPPSFVESKIETFFETFEETLTALTDEQFSDYVEGLAMKKLEKPKRLNAEASRYWEEVSKKQYHFRRGEREVEVLRGVTKGDLLDFYRKFVSPRSVVRRRLVVVVLGKNATSLLEGGGGGGDGGGGGGGGSGGGSGGDGGGGNGDISTVEQREWNVVDDILKFKSGLSMHPHVLPYNNIPLVSSIKFDA